MPGTGRRKRTRPCPAWRGTIDFDSGTQYNFANLLGRLRVLACATIAAARSLQQGERYAGLILGRDGAPDYHLALQLDKCELVHTGAAYQTGPPAWATACRIGASRPCCMRH